MEQICNYIKIAIRSLFRYRSDAILNVVGLSVGITISLVMFMYVRYELAYDNSYKNSNQTYRIITKGTISDKEFESAVTPMPLSQFLRDNFQEAEHVTRIVRGANKLVSYSDKKFNEDNFFYADSAFFSVFNVPFIIGDASSSLKKEEDVVITSAIANKYFGKGTNPIGKEIKLDNGLSFKVSAVCEPQPANSHFHFDFIASQQSIKKLYLGKNHQETESYKNNWLKIDWYTYVVLRKDADAVSFEENMGKKLDETIAKHINNIKSQGTGFVGGIQSLSFHVQPLKSIHLHSNLDNELESNSKYLYVSLFVSIAIFVLLITCINFMNLTTARVSLRIKEIGVRKLVGGHKRALVTQFIVEAITYSFAALFIGLVLVELLLPVFNALFDLNLRINRFEGRYDLLNITILTFIIGILSGLYPALSFSKLNEVAIFRNGFQPQKKGVWVRGILAATQMAVTTFLIILSLGMLWQIQYLKHKNLGFDSRKVIVVERGYSIGKEYMKFKQELKTIPGVEEVSACYVLPGAKTPQESFMYESKEGNNIALLSINYIEKDFFKTLGIIFESGGIWHDKSTLHKTPDLLINQKAKEELQMNKPLGQTLRIAKNNMVSSEFAIKGVFKDFHFEPLQFPVRPMVLMEIPKGTYYNNLLIKVSDKGSTKKVLGGVKKKWDHFTGNDPFEHRMLDDFLNDNLKEETLVLKILFVFTLLSMLIAWLGLRAFAAYTGEMKHDEFKSKKIIGASSLQIFTELFMAISRFVLPGILTAIPSSFVVLSQWLNGFAYNNRLPLSVMIAVSGVVWGLSFVLVLLHSNKSIKASPANTN